MAKENNKANNGDLLPVENFPPTAPVSNLPARLSNYTMLANPKEVGEIIRENAGAPGIDAFMLDMIKVPSGGATHWTIKNLNGEEDVVKTVEGIVIYFTDQRSYWEKSIEDGGGNCPPNCHSADLKTGVGNPGGNCAECPLNLFESDLKGKGKACTERRLLFLLRPGEGLPTIVSVPPTSLKNCRQFFMRLGSRLIRYYGLVMEISLTKAKSAGGVDYSEINFKIKDALDPESLGYVQALRENLIPVLSNVKAQQ